MKQQQQQRSSLQDQLRQQENHRPPAASCATPVALTQLGKDISGLNASIAKLQKQQSAQQNLSPNSSMPPSGKGSTAPCS